jgi:Flp pilus assembly pilin Flp
VCRGFLRPTLLAMEWGNWARDEHGQTSVEYALVIGVAIAIVLILSAVLSSGVFDTFWSNVSSALT